ncbi:hypothetical protein [Arthrobacter globiformis]|uniref:PH domain-containing protein n=1 Tax=Arthrobacter globiformis TaxID=1665 RepID=A0A328HF79_ARTGO|nr:hypothetical protein [Arthrobacter globiformis]RAM37187.1 hypothetical protein DBZ45_11420 [Arthrobacter globiformis]
MRLDGHSVAKAEDGQAVTHRAPSARAVAAAVWLLAAGTLSWLLVGGATTATGEAAPWLILLSWLVYVAQWRPCLRVDGFGFEVINGWRDHRIPFGAVEDIEVRFTTVIWAAGKKYVSWGAPPPPTALGAGFQHLSDLKSRPYSILPSNERISQPEARTGRDAVVAAWHRARFGGITPGQDGVTSRWNKPVIAVGVLAGLAVVITASF